MAGIVNYINEAADELLNKVSWPTYAELQSSSIIVLIATFFIAAIVYAMDVSFNRIMSVIYQTLQ